MDKEWIIDKLLHAGTEVTDESNDECDAVWLTIPRASVDDVAEAIAQAHEQELRNAQLAIMPCGHHASNVVGADEGTAYCEMCELEGQIEESQGHVRMASKVNANLAREIPKLQGQVAVMAEALELHDELRDLTYDTGYYAACIEVADKDEYMPLLNEAKDKRNRISGRMKAALQSAPKVLYAVKAKVLRNDENGVRLVFVDNDERTRVSQTPFPGVLRIQADSYEDEILDAHVIVLEGTNALQEQSKAQEPDKECSVLGKQGQNSEQMDREPGGCRGILYAIPISIGLWLAMCVVIAKAFLS